MSESQADRAINFSSFADWCKHKDSLSESARYTVEVLLKWADAPNCKEADRVFSNLTELDLINNQITDLTPLSALTNLTRLHLQYNQITDISPLSALINLTDLSLGCNQITDITPFLELTNLTILSLEYNQNIDITPLSALTNLTILSLSNNKITDITPLSALTNLTILCLGNNQITNIIPLSALTNLTTLSLNNNQITDITPLLALINLTFLNLEYNQITDLTPLSALTNLTDLCLGCNHITQISPLLVLTNLTELFLGCNQITEIAPLSKLTNLTRLYLGCNQITDITSLSAITNLNDLAIEKNPITDLNLSLQLIQKYLTLSTVTIDYKKAIETVKQLYVTINRSAPKVIVCSSPQLALMKIIEKLKDIYKYQPQISQMDAANSVLGKSLLQDIFQPIDVGFSDRMLLRDALWNTIILEPDTDRILVSEFEELLDDYPESLGYELGSNSEYLQPLTPTDLLKEIHLTEFFISKFGVTLDEKAQELFRCKQQLLEHCGWILPFEKICLICDRPLHIRFDAENRLHAEGESAIAFADGYSLYFHHGVKLPEQYGKVHPDLWQAEWLLSEENAEIRRLLIERIGYDRLCQQLQAVELDSWQEYTLLKIDNADVEPIYLLKMTCPSTGFIHALRVPPDVESAKEAIRWVNWDIDPEEFGVQT